MDMNSVSIGARVVLSRTDKIDDQNKVKRGSLGRVTEKEFCVAVVIDGEKKQRWFNASQLDPVDD
jgi:hypothetical protein